MALDKKIFCATCGGENKASTSYCIYCGAKLLKYNPESQQVCPKCRRVNKIENKFCRYCGINIKHYQQNSITFSEIPEPKRSRAYICGIIIGIMMLMYGINFLIFYGSFYESFFPLAVIFIGIGIPLLVLAIIFYNRAKVRAKETKKTAKPSIFSITDDFIKISLPNVQNYQVNWSKIQRVKILWRKGRDFSLEFYNSTPSQNQTILLREYVDFNKKGLERIMKLIVQYSKRKNIKVKKKIKGEGGGGGSFDCSGCDCTCGILILLALSLSLGWSVFDPHIPNEKLTLDLPILLFILILGSFSIIGSVMKSRTQFSREEYESLRNPILVDLSKKKEI